METAIIGLICLLAAIVLVSLLAVVWRVALVAGIAAVLLAVWLYPSETYAVVHQVERHVVQLLRVIR